MNYKYLRIIRSIVLANGVLLLLLISCLHEKSSDISFSHESGFYSEAFQLEIRGGRGLQIHYTLDASEPTLESPRYNGPIQIEDTSDGENVYSSIAEIYYGFSKELEAIGIVDPETDPRKIPSEPIDKACIVKAASFDREGKVVDRIEAVYFIGFDEKEGYEGINIISISTDPQDLFDYETGIYVTGEALDDYLLSLDRISKFSVGKMGANYKNRGKQSRRKAYIVFFDINRKVIENGIFDISIQGGTTRNDIPRSLNIYETSDEELDGKALGYEYDLESLNLFSGGNDRYTKIKDAVINEAVKELDICTRIYYPYEAFIEGEYWGVYFLSEKFDGVFFQGKYGVNSKDVIMIKRGSSEYVEIGEEKDKDDWNRVKEFIITNDMFDMNNYEYVKKCIDIESCIDYFATEIYIANTDWPYINVSVWKSKSKNGDAYNDGKWRWVLFDVNCSMEVENASMDGIETASRDDEMFRSLMDNPEFEQALKEKLVYLATNTFNPSHMRAVIMKYHDFMLLPMKLDYARFYGDKSISDYTNECNRMVSFFEQRASFILKTYDSGN